MKLRALSLLFVPVILTVSQIARAQSATDQAAAETLFNEGKRLMAAGSLAEACPKLAESQRLDPGAGTLINLGACYEQAGKTASAWATYAEAAMLAQKANRKQWETLATKKKKELEPQLSRLTITVPASSKVPGLRVERDGAVVNDGAWGVSVPVDPGAHVVRASAEGRTAWITNVQIAPKGDAHVVTVPALTEAPAAVMTPVIVAPPQDVAPQSEPTSSGNGQRTIGLVIGGAGVVVLGAGVVFGVMAMSDKSASDEFCSDDHTRCQQAGLDKLESARSKATISTIAIGAGAAMTVGGIVLYLMAPKAELKVAGMHPMVSCDAHGCAAQMMGGW